MSAETVSTLAILAIFIVAYAGLAHWLARRSISMPMVFVAVGFLLARLGAVDPGSSVAAGDYFERRRREVGGFFKRWESLGPGTYRGPVADFQGRWHILVLTTTGRKSGLPRKTALTLMYRPEPPAYVVGGGLGQRCDWYRNILANPEVVVQIGHRCFRACAAPITDPKEHRKALEAMVPLWDRYGPPVVTRRLMRRFMDFDYDAEFATARAYGDAMPIAVLAPHDEGPPAKGSSALSW
jgi:deazaflavin-dependent oxidoreductase (nitroreductase family)